MFLNSDVSNCESNIAVGKKPNIWTLAPLENTDPQKFIFRSSQKDKIYAISISIFKRHLRIELCAYTQKRDVYVEIINSASSYDYHGCPFFYSGYYNLPLDAGLRLNERAFHQLCPTDQFLEFPLINSTLSTTKTETIEHLEQGLEYLKYVDSSVEEVAKKFFMVITAEDRVWLKKSLSLCKDGLQNCIPFFNLPKEIFRMILSFSIADNENLNLAQSLRVLEHVLTPLHQS